MSDIQTSHNGHQITYNDNNDTWRCYELELEAKTLSALKAKIGKIDAQARKLDNVPVLRVSDWGGHDRGVALAWADKDGLWVMDGRRRAKWLASEVVVITPEVDAVVTQAEALQKQARALDEQARNAFKALPRIQPLADIPADDTP